MESEDEADLSSGSTQLLLKLQTQGPNDRKVLREKYQQLIENAQKEKENDEFNTRNIMENMNQADELFKEVCRPREAISDAKLMQIHGEIVKKKAHSIQTGSPFSSAVFLRRLASVLTGVVGDSDVSNLDQEAWLNLGNKVFRMFNRVPKLNFIHGTFLEPVEIVRQPRRLRDKEAKSKTSEPKVVDATTQKTSTDKTYEEIQRIKKILYNLYRKKGTPICYFHFTVDPNSFSRTIENMFHLAFLIKEREVHLSQDRHELPVIEPVLPGGTTADTQSAQSVLTMNVEKWKQLIEVFEIGEAVIPPTGSSKGSRR